VTRQVSWLTVFRHWAWRWLRLPAGSSIELAVAWQRTSPFTVAGAAAALTAFPS